MSTTQVNFMTPGLAFFYGGLVRRNHVLSIIIQNYVCMGIITLVWVVWGFSLCFGASGRFIGDPSDFAMLNRVNYKNLPHEGRGKMGEAYVEGIPGLVFAAYQGMFAVITPALMTGAFAERIKFGPFLVFVVLWVHLVYFPWCHWVWGPNGWLMTWGVCDFAGGLVVHVTAGFSALATVMACVEKNLRRVRRDACSMAWRCRFLAARPSQDGRVVEHPTQLLISTQASTGRLR